MSSTINQKEYLKKYLGIGKKPGDKKKKKKKDNNPDTRFKIIDDDVDFALSKEIQEDISASNEDAPQIVAIIDERPPSLRIDENTKSKLWKPIGGSTDSNADMALKINSFQLKKSKGSESFAIGINKNKLKQYEIDIKNRDKSPGTSKSDFTLSRSKNRDVSPPRRNDFTKRKVKNEDFSPPRKYSQKKNEDGSSPRLNIKIEKDSSPPRRSSSEDYSPKEAKKEELSPLRRKTEVDLSPPRKKYRDLSPVRRKDDSPHGKQSEDLSPPRKKDKDLSPSKKKEGKTVSPSRKHNDVSPSRRKKKEHDHSPRDLSPPHSSKHRDNSFPEIKERKHKEGVLSPKRKFRDDFSKKIKRKRSESPTDTDLSPPRKNKKKDDVSSEIQERRRKENDRSPKKSRDEILKTIKKEKSESPYRKTDRDLSPPRRNKSKDLSPPKRAKRSRSGSPPRQRLSRWGDKSPEPNRRRSKTPENTRKTLSGKKAGLQSAKNLAKEMISLKEKEDEVFRTMSEEVSGKNATTIVRGEKPKDPEKEAKELKKEKETKEKYDRWGKGLKQVQDEHEKMLEQLHEMNKPLARYADDEDLERFLKEQEREGDPMLAYIRKKKKKKAVETGTPEKPVYMGEFLPNRYGIRPGYRWDGVDRSTGYEKKWFETLNARKAVQEEAFKWSTEDM